MKTKKTVIKSPLRYPGGKTRAIAILDKYVQTYYPDRNIVLSPFFGGGSFELYLKSSGYHIYANDLFYPLYTFWTYLQNNSEQLYTTLQHMFPFTKQMFQNARKNIFETSDPGQIAALYFAINRSSFNGSTCCGGYSSQAAEKRFNQSSLERMKECNVSNIIFSNIDAISFLNQYPETSETLVFADPPYYIEHYIYGKDGDLHESFNHTLFASEIQKRQDWIICYNDCEYIRNLYKDCRIFKESWSYGMNKTKESSEIIILPPL